MIRADNLWKKFGRHEALRGLSFSAPEGSAFALIGANGAGKTTTIKILMNMLEATRGVAAVLGVDSRRISPRELERIGYVSENQDMPSSLTVGQYLDYLRPFYSRWDRDLEASVRRQLRLPSKRRIGDLSHGMRMKMALACALPFRPALLILDEPFSGLDPLVRDEFMEGLLQQAGEMTVLISSHELSEIDGVATHVAFIDEGSLLFEEAMGDLTGRFREVQVNPRSSGSDADSDAAGLAASENDRERARLCRDEIPGRGTGRPGAVGSGRRAADRRAAHGVAVHIYGAGAVGARSGRIKESLNGLAHF